MDALVEGNIYDLSSCDKFYGKTLIFVKLTDSALKSIEDYVLDKPKSTRKNPVIQFNSNSGVLSLPGDSHKKYGFSLSNVETDGPQGSFECLHQMGLNSLGSLGCMLLKMHIKGNEESYEKTRVKMAAVEKESKKFCTKEITTKDVSSVARTVKIKRVNSNFPVPSGSTDFAFTRISQRSSGNSMPELPSLKQCSRKKISGENKLNESIVEECNLLTEKREFRECENSSVDQHRKKKRISHYNHDENSTANVSSNPGKSQQSSNGAKRPSENLITKCNDNSNVKSSHTVQNGIHKQMIDADKKSSSHSLHDLTNENSKTCYSDKKYGADSKFEGQVYKFNEIIDFRRKYLDNDESSSSVLQNLVNGGNEVAVSEKQQQSFSSKVLQSLLKTKSEQDSKVLVNGNSETHMDEEDSNQRMEGPYHISLGLSSNSSSSSDSEEIEQPSEPPQYLKTFVKITSKEQRAEYKSKFNEEYEEYKALYDMVRSAADKFEQFEDKLRKHLVGSLEYYTIKWQIYNEYMHNTNNEVFQNAKQKLEYLHGKLSHIKQLVMDFDKNH